MFKDWKEKKENFRVLVGGKSDLEGTVYVQLKMH